MTNLKIAILARPRTGSTSLYRMLESHLHPKGFQCFYEPYNPKNYVSYYKEGFDFDYIDPFFKYDQVLTKTLFGCSQHPKKSTGNDERRFTDWMKEFFDKVIVLDRRDKGLQAESLLINLDSKIGWDIPKIYDVNKIDQERLKNEIESFKYFSDKMTSIAEQNSWPIFYYEDLFVYHSISEIEKMLEYIGVEIENDVIYDYIISDKRKVRIDPD